MHTIVLTLQICHGQVTEILENIESLISLELQGIDLMFTTWEEDVKVT